MKRRSLSYLFEFTEEDLVANRDQYLTKKQRVQLRSKGRELGFLQGIGYALLIGLALTPIINELERYIKVYIYVDHNLFNVIVLVLFSLLAFILGRLIQRPYLEDLWKGDVCCASGRVWQRSISGQHSITVDHERFDVSKEVMQTFSHGGFYRIYFVPHSRDIISAEFVSDRLELDKDKVRTNASE